MTTADYTLARKGWEQILVARTELLKLASQDTLKIIKTTNLLKDLDYHQTILTNAKLHRNSEDILRHYESLAQLGLRGVEDTRKYYQRFPKIMDEFKGYEPQFHERGDVQWKMRQDSSMFANNILDPEKRRKDECLERLKGNGEEIIRKMPEAFREAAAQTYVMALSELTQFFLNALDQINSNFVPLRHSWDKFKVKDWEFFVEKWFVATWNSINACFGGKFTDRAEPDGSGRYDDIFRK